jgi:hypothetical protein
MSEQVVIKAAHVIATGVLVTGPGYLKTISYLGSTTAGHLKFYDGSDNTGTLILEIDVPGNANNPDNVTIPTPGLLFNKGLYVEVPTGGHVTVFHGL